MTHKIYLIKHLDTGMGYVGVTSRDLLVRWKQHHSDSYSALYEVLRTDSHRMTMELLEEFEDRDQALQEEQKYIRKLGTAQPNGWNRQVTSFYDSRGYSPHLTRISYSQTGDETVVCCPLCGGNLIMNGPTDIRKKQFECQFICVNCHANSFHRQKGPRGGWAPDIVHSPSKFTLKISLDSHYGNFRIGMIVWKKDYQS